MAGHRLWSDGAVSIGKGFFLAGGEIPQPWDTCCPNPSYPQCHPLLSSPMYGIAGSKADGAEEHCEMALLVAVGSHPLLSILASHGS